MATLDQEPFNKTRSISNSKSTSTPISIVDISIPENEDLDTHTNVRPTSRPLSTRSYCSNLSSLTEPMALTPPLNEIISLPANKTKNSKSSKKSNKYYKNLMSPSYNPNIEIHAKRRYKLDDGRSGICQFIGQTSFAKGIWVGILLEGGHDGNTNGTVYGKKYFQCREGKGIFVRPNKIVHAFGSSSSRTPSTRTRAKSAKKNVKKTSRPNSTRSEKLPTTTLSTHMKSISSDATLSMSTSSPLHYTDDHEHVHFGVFDEQITTKHKNKHMLTQTKQPSMKKAKSAQITPTNTVKAKSFKYRNAISPIARYRSQSKQETNHENKHTQNINIKYTGSPILPLTPLLDDMPSKSADNSPYLTPISQEFAIASDINIPILSAHILCHADLETLDSDEEDAPGVVLDTFSALRAYFDDHQDILSDGEGYSLRDKLWGSSDDDESEGARSDSMLDDEDWVNRQHRARQASMAQSLADALTIPALHLVQKKVGTYIGSTEKWKPPKYAIAPDHSSVLKEKLLHHKKHLDEKWKNPLKVLSIKKLGPTEIGWNKDYKSPKYDTVGTPESTNTKTSFLDRDKGWYHKPSRVSQSQNHMKTQSLDGKKRNKSPRKSAKMKQIEIEKKQIETEKKQIETEKKSVSRMFNKRTEKWKSEHHIRSYSEIPRRSKRKKKLKKKTNKWKADKENEWFESDSMWIPRKETRNKNRIKKLGPRDIGRSSYKGTKLNGNGNKNKNKKQSINKKNKKSKNKNKNTIRDLPPNRISLPAQLTVKNKSKSKPDTPQTSSSTSTLELDSISPFASNFAVSAPMNEEYKEYMAMSIVEDDEEDTFVNTTSIGALFRTDAVIFEDTDLDSNNIGEKRRTMPPKDVESGVKKSKLKKKKKKGNKNKKVERSLSLFTGSSNKKLKEKRQKAAKNKVKEINSAKSIVQNVKSKENVNKKKNSKSSPKKKGKTNKSKKKKNKIWKKSNTRTPTL